MTATQSLFRPLTGIAVAGLLAGCAAAESAPPTPSSMPLGVSRMQSLARPIEPAKSRKTTAFGYAVFGKPLGVRANGHGHY